MQLAKTYSRALIGIAGIAVLLAQDTSATLRGQVRGWQDAVIPYVNAELALQDPPHTVFSVQTDKDGNFKFKVLPAGTYRLTLNGNGFRKLILKSIKIAEGEQKDLPALKLDPVAYDGPIVPVIGSFELLPGHETSGNLNGRVQRVQRRSIVRALVTLLLDDKTVGQTKTDANGEFVFFNLEPSDDYAIRVSHPGYQSWHWAGYEVQAGYDVTYYPIVLSQRTKLSRAASTVR